MNDILQVTMPNRALTACFAFAAGAIISGSVDLQIVVLGMLMIVSTYCSAAVYNNIRDVDGDKVNSPERPLPSGRMSIRFAWTMMFVLIAMGFLFGYLASPFLTLVNLAYIFFGVLYSKYTKSVWIFSYATLVTTHIAIPLLSGYLVFEALDPKIITIIGFVYLTEVLAFSLKDYKDIEGDRKMHMDTLPIVFEKKTAVRITAAGLTMPLLISWIPWHVLALSSHFIVFYFIAGAIRFRYARRLMQDPSPASAGDILKNFRYVLLAEMVAWCLA